MSKREIDVNGRVGNHNKITRTRFNYKIYPLIFQPSSNMKIFLVSLNVLTINYKLRLIQYIKDLYLKYYIFMNVL
jgi:hypothetical protein